MIEKPSPITDLISPNWFTDITKSSVWIAAYRMVHVTQENFTPSPPAIDLGDVRVIFTYGKLGYMDATSNFELGKDHARTINFSKKETNIGGWTILITPYVRDGVERSELETRNSLAVAEGILVAFNNRNLVYEKVFDNITEVSTGKATFFSPAFALFSRSPSLQVSKLQLLSQCSLNMQALPKNVRNKVALSLRWYSKSLKEQNGIDGFLSIWIAIEVIGMPDTTDVKPAVTSLAQIYQIDYQTAKDRFQLGKIQGFRSGIVHNGKMYSIHSLLTAYIEAIYIDLLTSLLNLPSQRRAEQVLKDSQFDLKDFIHQT